MNCQHLSLHKVVIDNFILSCLVEIKIVFKVQSWLLAMLAAILKDCCMFILPLSNHSKIMFLKIIFALET